MPLFKDIVDAKTRVLVWKIDESESDLLVMLNTPDVPLPQNGQRRLERLSVFCLLKYAGLPFPYGYNIAGQPVVNDDIYISISHSVKYVALAVNSQNAVGVDVEQINRNFSRVMSRYLTPTEQKGTITQVYLSLIWSAKEAVYKLGWGRNLEISKDIEVKVLPSTFIEKFVDIDVFDFENKTELRLQFEQFDGYTLAWVSKNCIKI